MANTTDKSILTAAGKALLAQLNAEEKPLIIDKMIFANVPNRPEFPQPDDVVPTDHVVHQEGVEQRGRLSADSVIYSTTLTSDVGPFEFNWTGAYCSEYGVLVTIDHHALTPKSADEPGVAGNTLVRSVVLEYKDIAEITNITVDASSWQYNATPRMKKMDDDVAQAIIDQNGKDWFIEDGFLVTPQASAFNIKAGAGYVSGNRVMLEFDRNVQVPNKPSFIYVDAHREGTPTGEQVTLFDFVITAEERDDYTDANGVKHFVCKVAQVLGDGSVSDLRSEGEVLKRERNQTAMLSGYHSHIVGRKNELIGKSIGGETAVEITDYLISDEFGTKEISIFLEIISGPKSGVINDIDLENMIIQINSESYFLDNGFPELSKCPFAKWSSTNATTQGLQRFFNMKTNARREIDVDVPVLIDGNVFVVDQYAIDLKTSGKGKVIVDANFKDEIAVWVSGLPYPVGGDTSMYWDVNQRQGGVSLLADVEASSIEIDVMGLSFTPGAKILLMSNEAYVSTRPQYKKGEFAVVESVIGSKVRLATMLRDSYLAAETKVFLMAMPELQCDRFDVVRSDDDNYQVGIMLYECADIDVKKISARGFKNRCFEVSHCYNGEVVTQRTKFASKSYDVDNRTSYSCLVASSENIEFRGGSAIGGRHSFACGGYIPNRNIRLRGLKIAVDDVDANAVAALDSHENIEGLSVKHCEVLGGANLAGQNVEVSHCDISTRRQIRALVFRPAKSCDYIKANNITIDGKIDSLGGIVIRPMAADIIINHVERSSNSVTIETKYNRSGMAIEPTSSGSNLKIEKFDEHKNNVVVHAESIGATCYTTCDVDTLENLPRIAVMNWSDNRGYITKGTPLYFVVNPESGYLYAQNGNNLQSKEGASSSFQIKGFKYVRWIDNDVIGNDDMVANDKTNIIADAVQVTVKGGSISKACANGFKFINVDKHKVSSLDRIDCVIDHQNFQSDNNNDEVKFKALIDEDGSIINGFNIESVTPDGNGRYTIRLKERMEVNEYPISVTPSLPTNSALSNNYHSIVVNYSAPTKFSIFG